MSARETIMELHRKKIAKLSSPTSLEAQLEAVSHFCSLMGSALAQMLWSLSKIDDIAQLLTQSAQLEQVLEVTRSCLLVYSSQAAGDQDPAADRLVLCLVGLVSNIAASRPRIVLSCGRPLIKTVLSLTPKIVTQPPRQALAQGMIDLLYNVSLDEIGGTLLQNKSGLALVRTVLYSSTAIADVHLASLRLLASITSRPLPLMLQTLVPLERVEHFDQTGDTEMRHYAEVILENMKCPKEEPRRRVNLAESKSAISEDD